MNPLVCKIVSLVSLLLTIIPCILFFTGTLGHEAVKTVALIGTVVWFISTPLWMGRDLSPADSEVEI